MKIKDFFNNSPAHYYQQIYKDLFTKMPLSLQMEISLNSHKELVKKVSIFNLGSPLFVFSVFKFSSNKNQRKNCHILLNKRSIYPKFAMSGDIILRYGEVFDEFFIIKTGQVEILSNDGVTRLAILESGAFFGEVALFHGKRTATVRALTDCMFLVLQKEKLEMILKLFPEERRFLMKVAAQRLKTSTKNDYPLKEVNLFN